MKRLRREEDTWALRGRRGTSIQNPYLVPGKQRNCRHGVGGPAGDPRELRQPLNTRRRRESSSHGERPSSSHGPHCPPLPPPALWVLGHRPLPAQALSTLGPLPAGSPPKGPLGSVPASGMHRGQGETPRRLGSLTSWSHCGLWTLGPGALAPHGPSRPKPPPHSQHREPGTPGLMWGEEGERATCPSPGLWSYGVGVA